MIEYSEEKQNFFIPPEIKGKFNWGAFWLTGFWGISNGVWVALIAMLIPILGLPISIWLGFKGNEIAWKAKNWKSIEHFNQTQMIWGITGTILGVIYYVWVINKFITLLQNS